MELGCEDISVQAQLVLFSNRAHDTVVPFVFE